MNRLRRAALISEMLDRMIEKGSWAGKTHLQKCLFFLQSMGGVPTDYEFQLYRYGPFSFELRDEIVQLQAEDIIRLAPRSASYSSSLKTTDASKRLRKYFSKTLDQYGKEIDLVADHFGALNASELEPLATAFYFHLEDAYISDKEVGEKVNAVKPRISVAEATAAARRTREIAGSMGVGREGAGR